MKGINILSTGLALPGRRVTNDDMAAMVETSDEWISTRTGIRQRYFCAEGQAGWQLAAQAGARALENAGVSPHQIGVCLVATMTPAFATPSAACLVQRQLGLEESTLCFDINAACSGFVYALITARALLESSPKPYALVIGAEALSKVTDFTDRSTCVLFGDGAAAAVMELTDLPFAAVQGARGDDQALVCPGFGSAPQHLSMDGRAVFRFAVEVLPRCVDGVLEQSVLAMNDIDYVVCHQANKRIIDHVVRRAGVDPAKFYMNMDRYGNTSAASIPLALEDMRAAGLLRPGMRLVCAGFGGGFTWGGVLVHWNVKGETVCD